MDAMSIWDFWPVGLFLFVLVIVGFSANWKANVNSGDEHEA